MGRMEDVTNAIEARGLVKRFGKTTALADVDLTARAGTLLGHRSAQACSIRAVSRCKSSTARASCSRSAASSSASIAPASWSARRRRS